jgi:DNA polymerase I
VVGENLRKALDWLPTARELITIRCDVGIQERLSDLAPQPADKAKLAELFERFNFKTWRKELDNMPAANATPAPMPAATTSDLFADSAIYHTAL